MKIVFASINFASGVAMMILFGHTASGGELRLQSREGQRASLIELYTSEGCSSCPPAEAWLSQLTNNPKLWTEIVPVAFHVDYWDNLGWRDRFASQAWTARQRAYAAAWGSSTVYTPGFVLDGREWQDSSSFGGRSLPAPAKADGAGQISAVVKDGKTVTVTYRPADRINAAREVSVALLGCDLNSNVRSGENSGRSLRHDFVALAVEKKKLSNDKPEGSATFELSAAPADAKHLALAVWVEEPGRAGIQQATGGWLTNASETRN